MLKNHVEKFQDTYNGIKDDEVLTEEDWHNMLVYITSLKTLSEASALLEGQSYPTAPAVIPYLDQVFSELTVLVSKLPLKDRDFPSKLLKNLQTSNSRIKRFPNGYKSLSPYNSLTLTDPRFMDIYFSEEETKKALEDIASDKIFDNLATESETSASVLSEDSASITVPPNNSPFAQRRAKLLATKQTPVQSYTSGSSKTFLEKLTKEKDMFVNMRGMVEHNIDPMDWWRKHITEVPLLGVLLSCLLPLPSYVYSE